MALIPNFPQDLLDMHHHWHEPAAHPGAPGGRQHPFGTTGAGLEFLQFHRDYMAQFHAWYNGQLFGNAPFDAAPFLTSADAQAAVAPWTSVPAEVKDPMVTGWSSVQAAQEARLTSLTPAFASADELGTYIEGGIHGWIHGATATAFNEFEVQTFHSPRSTYFYGIHGLVDFWWRQWERTQKHVLKDIIDSKARIKEFKEHKEFIKEHKEFVFEKPQPDKQFKEMKEKDKDIFEGGGLPGGGGDPVIMTDLARRVQDLETKVTQQAFIQPQERPAVGEAARSKKNK